MTQPLTTGALAQRLGAQLVGRDDIPIDRLDSLQDATAGALTFIRTAAFARRWANADAPAALVSAGLDVPGHDPATRALIVVPDADLALITVLDLFKPAQQPPEPGAHERAFVDDSAQVAPDASIAAGAYVGKGARVGRESVIHPTAVIEHHARVGDRCVIHPGVVVGNRCVIGDRCILYAGVIIGADGFGYRTAKDDTGLVKVPHIGNVVIGNDVEIGANSCIDRAKFGSTTVGDGTKIDNLVQIAHNCRVGRACIICGSSGLAGSVTLGDGVVIGGGAIIIDNATIGDGARIAAGAGIRKDVGPGETWMGSPARPHRETLRIQAILHRIGRGKNPFRDQPGDLE